MDCFSELESFLISLGPFEGFLFFIFEICASLFCRKVKRKIWIMGQILNRKNKFLKVILLVFKTWLLSLKTPFKKYDKKKKKETHKWKEC